MKTFSINGCTFTDDGPTLTRWATHEWSDAPEWEREYLAFLREWGSGVDQFTFFTSGSTGTPAPIAFTRGQLEASARLTASVFGCGIGASALLCLPGKYIAGKMMLARTVVNGWNLIWEKPSSLPFGGQLPAADFIAVTPMQLRHLLAHSPEALLPVCRVLVGGAPVSDRLREQCRYLPVRVTETYGMTETLTHIALRELSGPEASEWFSPLPGVQVGEDERGCLAVRPQHLGPLEFTTSDVVEWNQEGGFRILGRADFLINTGGVKVFPEQVERKLAHLQERSFYITSVPDEELGQQVVLCVEGENPGYHEAEALLSAAAGVLDLYERPRKVLFVPMFERTASGKIIRKKP